MRRCWPTTSHPGHGGQTAGGRAVAASAAEAHWPRTPQRMSWATQHEVLMTSVTSAPCWTRSTRCSGMWWGRHSLRTLQGAWWERWVETPIQGQGGSVCSAEGRVARRAGLPKVSPFGSLPGAAELQRRISTAGSSRGRATRGARDGRPAADLRCRSPKHARVHWVASGRHLRRSRPVPWCSPRPCNRKGANDQASWRGHPAHHSGGIGARSALHLADGPAHRCPSAPWHAPRHASGRGSHPAHRSAQG